MDDLARWVRAVRLLLPAAPDGTPPATLVGVVPAAAAGQPDTYRIRVEWTEPGEPRMRYEISMQLIPASPL